MPKISIIAKLTAKEGQRDDLVAAFGRMLDYVGTSEPGTEVYMLHTDDKDPNVCWFYEMYTDGDAAKAHGSSDMMKSVGKELAPFIAGRAELSFVTPVGGKGLSI
jgi:quinol monooxygenase YgiN